MKEKSTYVVEKREVDSLFFSHAIYSHTSLSLDYCMYILHMKDHTADRLHLDRVLVVIKHL